MRFHFTIRRLMLVVAIAGCLLAGLEMIRRRTQPQPPHWPWVIDCPLITHLPVTYINVEDVWNGVDPPRAKWDFGDGRVEDAPGPTLAEARRNPFLTRFGRRAERAGR